MKNIETDDYLRPKTYLGFLIKKITGGWLWRSVKNVYKKIRKYTVISGIIRAIGITVALLEKSAVLLLFTMILLLILPILLCFLIIYSLICVYKYISLHKNLREWLLGGQNLTVFITKSKLFSNESALFLRNAMHEASALTHPVVVVCTDRFIAAKWVSLNLLAVKTDYFFVLKQFYIPKRGGKTTVIVL